MSLTLQRAAVLDTVMSEAVDADAENMARMKQWGLLCCGMNELFVCSS